MEKYNLYGMLSGKEKNVAFALYEHCRTVLDKTHRFKYFTLHGTNHIHNMLKIADILLESGIKLNEIQAYYLMLSIIMHDVGMVAPLSDFEFDEVFKGLKQVNDLVYVESFVRSNHHKLIGRYIADHSDYFVSLGLSIEDLSIVKQIGLNHRKTDLEKETGYSKTIGALLRVVDELDVGPERAPSTVLVNSYKEMDQTSIWHWFKHAICCDWNVGNNVRVYTERFLTNVVFKMMVHPPSEKTISYWLRESVRPIKKVLIDECAGEVIKNEWGVNISVEYGYKQSYPLEMNRVWHNIETIALSAGKKVILVIDDEVRKMEDLFMGLTDDFFIHYSYNARDAFEKMKATNVDLAIVDMQISSGNLWSREETLDYKTTGIMICNKLLEDYPNTKIGILTGTQHDMSALPIDKVEFIFKKPVHPEKFEQGVRDVFK